MAFKRKAINYAKKAARGGKIFARKVGKNIRKRYSGKTAIPNLLKDVSMLKHLVNVEKKRFDVNTSFGLVNCAQINGAGISGQYAAIISPTPVEGLQGNQRIGLSLKLVSACMDIQWIQQVSAVNRLKIMWYIVCRPDNSQLVSAATSISQFFEVNPFSGVNDYYSARDPEYFNAYRVIKKGSVTLSQDQITSGTANHQIKVPLKLDHHLKFNTDTSTTTTKNQFYFFAVASGGDTMVQTGTSLQYNIRWYYTDN